MPADPIPSLAESPSPFLRHGATQPVNWLPWGPWVFERARTEGRPILLDIGGVWCHWCHVMDAESYDDPETARLINEHFIPVKVDRDERPDIDARYQHAVQAISGQGGWPLTAFLTPEGEVFYGGTYFPPDDRFGRPSFRRVLQEVARVWREERERAVGTAREIRARVSAYAQAESSPGELSPALVEHAVEAFAHTFDFRYGGFGRAPKFPNPGALALLLDRYLDDGTGWARRVVSETLDAMARGGIHDQLGGGFHRYATDARWRVPHFEKMAYDNGPLLEVYARAAAALDEPAFRGVADGIIGYYREIAPSLLARGGFPTSQDADIGAGDDGSYWTWTRREVEAALGGDKRLVRAAVLRYGLDDPMSSMPSDHERHVLYLALEVDEVARRLEVEPGAATELLDEVSRRLKAARDERPRPLVDETVYTGWAALVASGFLAAARFLGRPDAGRTALRALDRIWDEAFDAEDGAAHRVGDRDAPGGAIGLLEDQAFLVQALLDAYEWCQRTVYLDRARAVADLMLRRFLDRESGAFTDRPRNGAAGGGLLREPHLPIVDSPVPSGNGIAAIGLLRLAALLGGEAYRRHALDTLRAFAGSAQEMPTAVATYARAVEWAVAPVTTVVIVGEPDDGAAAALLRTAHATYRPRTVLRRLSPAEAAEARLTPALRAMVTGDSPRAYLCAGQTCVAPTADPDTLAEQLATFRG